VEPTPINGGRPRTVDVPVRGPEPGVPPAARHGADQAAPVRPDGPGTPPPMPQSRAVTPPTPSPARPQAPVRPRRDEPAWAAAAPPAPAPAPENTDPETTATPAAGAPPANPSQRTTGPVPDPAPMPIGRLTVSGPDGPRRYADAELGGSWFAKPARPAAGEPQTGQNGTAGQPQTGENETAGQPQSKEGAAAAPAAAREGGTTAERAGRSTAERAGAEERAGAAERAGRTTADEAGEATAEKDGDADQGMVLDFDITGLVNGTGEQPAVTPAGEPATDGAAEEEPAPSGPTAADLAAIRWRLDGGTLREVVDDRDALRELGERLDEPIADETDHAARAGLLSVRAEVYRLLGELGMAAAASRLALVHAETAGDPQATVIAQAELAHVLRLRGDFAEADRLFEEAASSEAPAELRSVVHENAGRCCFDQGRHMEALDHFGRAVRLGREDDTDLAERIEVSLEAVYIHVLRDGWGPYPRLRREIIGSRRPGPAGAEPA
jgi:hypothetical protein